MFLPLLLLDRCVCVRGVRVCVRATLPPTTLLKSALKCSIYVCFHFFFISPSLSHFFFAKNIENKLKNVGSPHKSLLTTHHHHHQQQQQQQQQYWECALQKKKRKENTNNKNKNSGSDASSTMCNINLYLFIMIYHFCKFCNLKCVDFAFYEIGPRATCCVVFSFLFSLLLFAYFFGWAAQTKTSGAAGKQHTHTHTLTRS